jgi:hypothetical protein
MSFIAPRPSASVPALVVAVVCAPAIEPSIRARSRKESGSQDALFAEGETERALRSAPSPGRLVQQARGVNGHFPLKAESWDSERLIIDYAAFPTTAFFSSAPLGSTPVSR